MAAPVDQLSLWARPAPSRRVPTSRAAAAAQEPKLRRDLERVLRAVVDAGLAGLTQDEVSVQLGMLTQTACARLNDLQNEHQRHPWRPLIERLGAKRPTRTGSLALVWTATGAGRRLVSRGMVDQREWAERDP